MTDNTHEVLTCECMKPGGSHPNCSQCHPPPDPRDGSKPDMMQLAREGNITLHSIGFARAEATPEEMEDVNSYLRNGRPPGVRNSVWCQCGIAVPYIGYHHILSGQCWLTCRKCEKTGWIPKTCAKRTATEEGKRWSGIVLCEDCEGVYPRP